MDTAIGNQLVQNQNLILTSKMIEDLKILQMSNLELEQYIENAIVDNPLLEVDDSIELLESIVNEDNGYNDGRDYYSIDDDTLNVDFYEYTSKPVSLRDHLITQLGELKIDLFLRKIALYIIESIDTNGYLRTDVREISRKLGVNKEKTVVALRTVQHLNPPGVGARTLEECLIIQLKHKKIFNEKINSVVKNYLGMLAERKYTEISKWLNISKEEVLDIHRVIKGLDPNPGQKFSSYNGIDYIIPELIAKEFNNNFVVAFNDDKVPKLKLNSFYRSMLKEPDRSSDANKYIRTKLSKAVEIINAIEQRKRTILSTANFIVNYQIDFFRKGFSYLKPLTMKTVASEIGMHESTVSRTVNNKYIQTPRGLFELKFFFSSRIETGEKNNTSANSIKDAIRKIVFEEEKGSPLSDEKIKKVLEGNGIKIARRTVTKYREELSILTAKLRR